MEHAFENHAICSVNTVCSPYAHFSCNMLEICSKYTRKSAQNTQNYSLIMLLCVFGPRTVHVHVNFGRCVSVFLCTNILEYGRKVENDAICSKYARKMM